MNMVPVTTTTPKTSTDIEPNSSTASGTEEGGAHSTIEEPSHTAANSSGSNPIHPTPTALSIPKSIVMDTMDINASLNGGESSSYQEDLCPPDNFNMVSTWIYRSSFPKKKNFSFLKKLGLKSIL
jgi:tyrosine-protein phosphatase SIW14